jgi:RimJ/RimL family protein N-acetyltransferase
VPALAFPDPPLGDGRTRLRPWSAADISAIVSACQDPLTQRFITELPSPYGETDAREWLAAQEPTRLEGDGIDLAVVDPEGRVLGAIGLRLSNKQRSAEVGYWLAPEARGQGHAARALRLLSGWLFSTLGVERLELTTDPENLASQRVAAACGFRQEGYLRSHLRVSRSGARRDSILWALLPGESRPVTKQRPQLVWLNGTFGAGKSSAAAELKRRRTDLVVFDPEMIGFVLRESVALPTGDFQDLPEWREVVAATCVSLARHQAGPVLVPMTLWRPAYVQEIFATLRAAAVNVVHVLLDASDGVLAARIDADPRQPPEATAFRRARLADYQAARAWLRTTADLTIDSDSLSVSEVADEIGSAMHS